VELNANAAGLSDELCASAGRVRAHVELRPGGARVIDLGITARGGLEAGRRLAEICLAGLGEVSFVPAPRELGGGLSVFVTTDWPVQACMASQYAGWQIGVGKFFAMGSGPMRAAAGKEKLFDAIGCRETPAVAVGVLETRNLPPAEVIDYIIQETRVLPAGLTLLVAPTASQAGAVQVVARSIETALHKLHELGFDLARIESATGVAPLPPVAKDDLSGIGRTNDAILYGGEVRLWLRGDDASLEVIGPRIPSSASSDHGRPFAEIFTRYDRDFYRIDPLLFSPAVIELVNLDSGRSWRFGQTMPEVIEKSFGS
jgi:methenyltetrahydromethanopterin cyclohydrolase